MSATGLLSVMRAAGKRSKQTNKVNCGRWEPPIYSSITSSIPLTYRQGCSWGQLLLSQHMGGSPALSFLGSDFSHVHGIVQCPTAPGTSGILPSADVWRVRGGKRCIDTEGRWLPQQSHRWRKGVVLPKATGRKLAALRAWNSASVALMCCQPTEKRTQRLSDSLPGRLVLFILSQGCLRRIYGCCVSSHENR